MTTRAPFPGDSPLPQTARAARENARLHKGVPMSPLLIAAGLIGFCSVALGAFGAHGLEGRLTAEGEAWWATATLYALAHSAAALACALAGRAGVRGLAVSGWAFVVGTLIFAGTLYAMALGAPRWFGAVTPIGGVSFLVGWALVVLAGFRAR